MVKAVLGQGFANASASFPMVRTKKWAGSHLTFLAAASCHGALPTKDENALALLGWPVHAQEFKKRSLPQAKKRIFFFFSEMQKAFFIWLKRYCFGKSELTTSSMSFSQFWNGKTCAMLLDTVIFVRQNRGQICWMFSKFQFYHKEPHAQTQVAWLTRAGLWSHWKAQFPANADGPNHVLWGKTWWKATIMWRLQGVFTAVSDKKPHCEELGFHASRSNSVLY